MDIKSLTVIRTAIRSARDIIEELACEDYAPSPFPAARFEKKPAQREQPVYPSPAEASHAERDRRQSNPAPAAAFLFDPCRADRWRYRRGNWLKCRSSA